MKRHLVQIIAATLLILPVLYVGSYLALVVPGGASWHYHGASRSHCFINHQRRLLPNRERMGRAAVLAPGADRSAGQATCLDSGMEVT
jgi:hypothetical protein